MSIPKIGIISLGCPKALVDTEKILTRLRAEGYELTSEYEEADLILINTCGFIEEAVDESYDAIAEALSKHGKVIVTGCLGKRAEQVLNRFPQLLGVTGPNDVNELLEIIHRHLPQPHDVNEDMVPPQGMRLTPAHYAYLKISEGCSHKCSFCIIPDLRGPLISRSIKDIVEEAERLVESGVQEILVVSQDTAAFGSDRRYTTDFYDGRPIKNTIVGLADMLGDLGIWIRLHYLYPYANLDGLVELMAEGKILPYLDMPLQHASLPILRSMRRPAATENMLKRIEKWRSICPEIVIRSTFITGFPGETQEDFDALLTFIERAQIDRLGCFSYSDIEGAESKNFPNKIPSTLAEERRHQLMELQKEISRDKLQKIVGQKVEVLIDDIDDNNVASGRRQSDAPDIDGLVYIEDGAYFQPGDLVEVTIDRADAFDCYVDKKPTI